jgi:imidazolonepropionase
MRQIITNISKLYHGGNPTGASSGEQMSTFPLLERAWVMLEGDTILALGHMNDLPDTAGMQQHDASGRLVLPAWCDSHTHLVFAASREREFVDRIKGVSYEEIARRGGGILNSAKRLNETSEEQLYDMAVERMEAAIAMGTGAMEIKSGYGLSVEGELKMLRVIKRLKETSRVAIKATLLAAHAYPLEYRENHEGYISLVIDTILPEVAAEGLADYMDVFCEQGFFSVDDTDRLLSAAAKYGLKPKIHANQLHYSGGVQVGVRHNAISVDHLECVGEAEIEALKVGNTMPTLLPGAAFFLGIQYQPARRIIDAGLPVCLATDFNPGSCPSSSVPLLLSIACTQLKMTPEEAINAVTINGAVAMELLHHYGTIAPGKKANLIITKPLPDVACIPYYFGSNPVERVLIGGHFA